MPSPRIKYRNMHLFRLVQPLHVVFCFSLLTSIGAFCQNVECGHLLDATAEIDHEAYELEKILLPVKLLRPQEENALRRNLNSQHLDRARHAGITPVASASELDIHLENGSLMTLVVETPHWRVRELDASVPYVVPSVGRLLSDIAVRFHQELKKMGLPAYRLEISSVLRTGSLQVALQRTNENAARGRSSHEYGATVDIAYEAFAAPMAVSEDTSDPDCNELLSVYRKISLERVAARKSRELTAILGRILREMQDEGRVLVLMERLQPVFHITVSE